VTGAVGVSIRRSPAGSVRESDRANLTLHCDVVGDHPGKVESVVWYYQGDLLTQLPQQDCGGEMEVSGDSELSSQSLLLAEGEVSNDLLEWEYSAIGDYIHMELTASGDDGGDAEEDVRGDVREDASGDGEEEAGEESGEDAGGMTRGEKLCGVDPDQLILHSVSREFSGQFSCAAVSGGILGPRAQELQLNVEYPPENISVSSEETLSVREGEMFEAVFCDADGEPLPLVSWWHRGHQLTSEATLDFTEVVSRQQAGEYVCQVSNIHGLSTASVTLEVQYKPNCEMNFSMQKEELILTCTADANPQDVRFQWQKGNATFEGQENEEILSSEVRLRIINESLGEYSCYVSNDLGDSSCSLEVTESIMMSGLSYEDIAIIVAAIITPFIITAVIIYCLCRKTNSDKEAEDGGSMDRKKNNIKSPLLKYDQLHADPEFYENLPFNKFQNPPKECVADDNLDYADCDYLDIYTNGPLKYREASERNASIRKKKLEERKAVKSSYL